MIVPITPITAWTTGQFNRMPIMGGQVQAGGTFGIGITEYFSGPPQVPIRAAKYVTNVTNAYSGPEYPGGPNYSSGTAAAVLAQYPPGADPQATFDLVGTHPGACRNRHVDHLWSKWVPVYERSEEHTSNSSHGYISYAVFCLKKKNSMRLCRSPFSR